MANEIVAVFKEFVERLEKSNIQGKLLDEVTLVEGPVEETFGEIDLPAIIYELKIGGDSLTAGFPKCERTDMTVILTVMTNVEDGYYSNEKLGMLDIYEKIMDVVHGEDTVDVTGNNKWGERPPVFRFGNFERDSLVNQFLVEIDFRTNRYNKGELTS
jgi:hypothetical protein